jgi:hypothetical protein
MKRTSHIHAYQTAVIQAQLPSTPVSHVSHTNDTESIVGDVSTPAGLTIGLVGETVMDGECARRAFSAPTPL